MSAPDIRATLLLLSYNQARFLPQAIAGAFAQDLPGLEIILSDDNSRDGSQDIIRQAAAEYRGPHRVVTNFNAQNLGIVRHVNLGFAMARGAVVVPAASDDISLPQRMRRIVETMEEPNGEPTLAIVSDAVEIDESGEERGYIRNCLDENNLSAVALARDGGYINGASAGYARALIAEMGDLEPEARAEDSILPFRAALLGRVRHIPEALLMRRVHDASETGAAMRDQQALLRSLRPMEHAFAARLIDLQHPLVVERFDQQERDELRALVLASIARLKLNIALIERRKGSSADLFKAVRSGDLGLGAALKMLAIYRLPRLWRLYSKLSAAVRPR
jgi:hypothetical protein